MQGRIINITRFCTDDGPGIRTTVFLKGCPLKCIWCHNPESQISEEQTYCDGETVGKTVTAEEVFQEVKQDAAFYDTSGGGVTVSGGEPLLQPKFTAEILRLCRENGIHTAMETSGFAGRPALEMVLLYCDLVLFDIKETDAENHRKYTGVPQEPILENLRIINDAGIPFILRLPIIPGLNDRREHFEKVKALAKTWKHCRNIQVMPYHTLGQYKYQKLDWGYACANIREPDKAQKEEWNRWLKDEI